MDLPVKIIPLPKKIAWLSGTYWKPNKAFVSELSDFLRGKKVLEIFAGNGLLAGMLAKEGVDVTATSILSGMDAHAYGIYHPVERLEACKAVRTYRSTHDVLLVCWPTTSNDAAFQAARLWGSDKDIVFIGEKTDYSIGFLGGCATDEFFEAVKFHHRFQNYGNEYEVAEVGRFSASI